MAKKPAAAPARKKTTSPAKKAPVAAQEAEPVEIDPVAEEAEAGTDTDEAAEEDTTPTSDEIETEGNPEDPQRRALAGTVYDDCLATIRAKNPSFPERHPKESPQDYFRRFLKQVYECVPDGPEFDSLPIEIDDWTTKAAHQLNAGETIDPPPGYTNHPKAPDKAPAKKETAPAEKAPAAAKADKPAAKAPAKAKDEPAAKRVGAATKKTADAAPKGPTVLGTLYALMLKMPDAKPEKIHADAEKICKREILLSTVNVARGTFNAVTAAVKEAGHWKD